MSDVETKTTKSLGRLDHSQEYNRLRENYATKMAALTAHTTNPPNIDAHILIRGCATSDENPNKLPLAHLMDVTYGQNGMWVEKRQQYWKEKRELFDWRCKVTSLSEEANSAFEQLTQFLDPSRNPLPLFPSVDRRTLSPIVVDEKPQSKRKNPDSCL